MFFISKQIDCSTAKSQAESNRIAEFNRNYTSYCNCTQIAKSCTISGSITAVRDQNTHGRMDISISGPSTQGGCTATNVNVTITCSGATNVNGTGTNRMSFTVPSSGYTLRGVSIFCNSWSSVSISASVSNSGTCGTCKNNISVSKS